VTIDNWNTIASNQVHATLAKEDELMPFSYFLQQI